MFVITANTENNYIFVTLVKKDKKNETEIIYNTIKEEISKLKEGFICITDIQDYTFEVQDASWMIRIQELLVASGMTKFITYNEYLHKDPDSIINRMPIYSTEKIGDIETANQIVKNRETLSFRTTK